MATLTSPITPASASTNAAHKDDLGKLVFSGGKVYRMCKANAAIATAASRVLKTALTAGVPTWVVDFPTAAVLDLYHVVVPASQVGTGTTTTTLAAGDYFLAQVSGATNFKAADTVATSLITAGMPLRVTTAGYVSSYTASPATGAINEWPGNNSRITNSAVVTAAGDVIPGILVGMI